jgi:hypothetical protein
MKISRQSREFVKRAIVVYLTDLLHGSNANSGSHSFPLAGTTATATLGLNIPHLAIFLEHVLYKQATVKSSKSKNSNFAAAAEYYADLATLKIRLKQVAYFVLQRKLKPIIATPSFTSTTDMLSQPQITEIDQIDYAFERRLLLCKQIGCKKFFEMEQLVTKIEIKRRTSTAWMCAAYFCHHRKNVDLYQEGRVKQISASEMLPPPLKELYFNTILPNAWARLNFKTSSLEPDRVMKYNWEYLFLDATNALETFESFERKLSSILVI